MAEMTPAERRAEESMALALIPIAKEIAAFVKARIPEGAHFGVMLMAAPTRPGEMGRVIALTSDREVVAPAVAQWVLTVLPGSLPPSTPATPE